MDNLIEFNFPLAVVLSAPLDYYAFPHPRPVGRMNTITYTFFLFLLEVQDSNLHEIYNRFRSDEMCNEVITRRNY